MMPSRNDDAFTLHVIHDGMLYEIFNMITTCYTELAANTHDIFLDSLVLN